MEKKQTAVEWLEEQIMEPGIHNPWIEQAKQMEKEQLVEFGRYYFHERGKLTPQQLYNEIYKPE